MGGMKTTGKMIAHMPYPHRQLFSVDKAATISAVN